MMTPREKAEAARKVLDEIQLTYSRLSSIEWIKLREYVLEKAITEHVRALLADDVKREIGDALPECYRHWGCIHAFVDALRRKALGE